MIISSSRAFAPFSLFCIGAILVALSGCEDPQARGTASDTAKQLDLVKAQLSNMVTKEELAQKINSLLEESRKQIDIRMDKLTDQLTGANKDLLLTLSNNSKQVGDSAIKITSTARSEYEQQLQAVKSTFSDDAQKIRAEIKAATDDLKQLMDNQLRELYPYAYQPRRMDPNVPPAPEAK